MKPRNSPRRGLKTKWLKLRWGERLEDENSQTTVVPARFPSLSCSKLEAGWSSYTYRTIVHKGKLRGRPQRLVPELWAVGFWGRPSLSMWVAVSISAFFFFLLEFVSLFRKKTLRCLHTPLLGLKSSVFRWKEQCVGEEEERFPWKCCLWLGSGSHHMIATRRLNLFSSSFQSHREINTGLLAPGESWFCITYNHTWPFVILFYLLADRIQLLTFNLIKNFPLHLPPYQASQ